LTKSHTTNPTQVKQSKIPYHQPHPPQKKALIKLLINNLIKAFWVLSIDGLLWWQIEYKDTSSFLFKIYQKTNQRYFCKGRDKAAGSLNELPSWGLHPIIPAPPLVILSTRQESPFNSILPHLTPPHSNNPKSHTTNPTHHKKKPL
jgi:hypothetical protein